MSGTTLKTLQLRAYKVILKAYGDIPIQCVLNEIITAVVAFNLDSRKIKEKCSDIIVLLLFLFEKLNVDYTVKTIRDKKESIGVIYKLTSPSNKVYVGQTKRFIRRMYEYSYSKNGKKQPKLYNALFKYGFSNFIISIIDICDSVSELNSKEEFWIKRYRSNIIGYNIRSGGSVSPMSEETKKKLSQNNWLNKYGASDDYRKKMSIACRGNKNGFYGKQHSTSTKNKLSSFFKGKRATIETREKMKKSHIGLKQTKETNTKKSLILSKNVYKITSPSTTELVSNLRYYSIKHNLSAGALASVASNKRHSHRGLKVQKIFDGTTGKKLRVGLLGGAMNPITLGHVEVAKLVLKSKSVDQVWVTPCNIHVYGKDMVDSSHRIKMCEIALLNVDNTHVFTREITEQYSGSTYSFLKDTINIFNYCTFSFVIGLDNANTFDTWVNYEELERLVRFVVVPRTGEKLKKSVKWFLKEPHLFIEPDEPLMKISSTEVRESFKAFYDTNLHLSENIPTPITTHPESVYTAISRGLNPKVKEYILKHNLYQ